MRAPFLHRLLYRTGAVSFLRELWRQDDASLREKLGHREARLTAALVDRVDEVAGQAASARDQAGQLEAGMSARLRELERDLRLLRRTLELNSGYRARPKDAALRQADVRSHVSAALAAAPMRDDPMPHLVVENVLPSPVYQALLDAIPPSIFFSQKDATKQNLRIDKKGILPDQTVEVFAFLEQRIIDGVMVPLLLDRFRPHIDRAYHARYGPERAAAVAAIAHRATTGRLMLRRPGYHLDPHLDPNRVIITVLCYLARPGDSEAYGTTFYRMDRMPRIEQTNTFYPGPHGVRCSPATSVPFRPNTAVIFLNHGGAHGADIPRDASPDTERYAYQFYIGPEIGGLTAIVGAGPGTAADDEY